MTIEQPEVVDIVARNEAKGEVTMIISDHLPWDVDEGDHLWMLQSKVNRYLDGLASGEFFAKCPKAIGKRLVIEIAAKYPLSENAHKLVDKLTSHLLALGIELRFHLYDQDADGNPIPPNNR